MSHMSHPGYIWPTARYRLTQKSYIARLPGEDPEIIDPELTGANGQPLHDPFVIWNGKPGPHMEPTCPLGEEAVKRAGPQTLTPINELSLVLGEDTDLDTRIAKMHRELTQLMLQRQGMPTGMDQTLVHAGIPNGPAEVPANMPPAPPAVAIVPPPVYAVPPPPPRRVAA